MSPNEIGDKLYEVETAIVAARRAISPEYDMAETKRLAWQGYRKLRELLGVIAPMGPE